MATDHRIKNTVQTLFKFIFQDDGASSGHKLKTRAQNAGLTVFVKSLIGCLILKGGIRYILKRKKSNKVGGQEKKIKGKKAWQPLFLPCPND